MLCKALAVGKSYRQDILLARPPLLSAVPLGTRKEEA
jgi:hypothetical protein